MKFRSIKGTKDILPEETAAWQHVESVIHTVMHHFNYQEIRTPVFEQTGLFSRSIGELTDIVSKPIGTISSGRRYSRPPPSRQIPGWPGRRRC